MGECKLEWTKNNTIGFHKNIICEVFLSSQKPRLSSVHFQKTKSYFPKYHQWATPFNASHGTLLMKIYIEIPQTLSCKGF
jgi:hypothetical protein